MTGRELAHKVGIKGGLNPALGSAPEPGFWTFTSMIPAPAPHLIEADSSPESAPPMELAPFWMNRARNSAILNLKINLRQKNCQILGDLFMWNDQI